MSDRSKAVKGYQKGKRHSESSQRRGRRSSSSDDDSYRKRRQTDSDRKSRREDHATDRSRSHRNHHRSRSRSIEGSSSGRDHSRHSRGHGDSRQRYHHEESRYQRKNGSRRSRTPSPVAERESRAVRDDVIAPDSAGISIKIVTSAAPPLNKLAIPTGSLPNTGPLGVVSRNISTAVSRSSAVASVFNNDDDDDEEMPPEAKMKMKNIGRNTPTSAGPNSFGKTKIGFCNALHIADREMEGKQLGKK